MIRSSSAADWNGREFCLGDDLLLAREGCSELFVLNNTAKDIWHAWRKQLSVPEISSFLADKYDVPIELTEQDVMEAFGGWKERGLIGGIPVQSGGLSSDKKVLTQDIVQRTEPLPHAAWSSECFYQLYSFAIRIRFANTTVERAVNALFNHLKVDTIHEVHTTFEVLQKNNSCRLYRDRQLILSHVTRDALVIGLLHEIIQAVYSQMDPLLILHAAAIASDDECIVFPGYGGSGKSTLTAALLQAGYTYLSDDLVPLDRETLWAIPLPISPNVKKGSLLVLESLFGSLEYFRKYRLEKREAWYLRTGAYDLQWARNCYPVKCLVFPQYMPGAATQLSPLSPADALQRIFKANSVCKRPTDLSSTARLVDWIVKVPAFSLTYESLDQATSEVRALFSSNEGIRSFYCQQ